MIGSAPLIFWPRYDVCSLPMGASKAPHGAVVSFAEAVRPLATSTPKSQKGTALLRMNGGERLHPMAESSSPSSSSAAPAGRTVIRHLPSHEVSSMNLPLIRSYQPGPQGWAPYRTGTGRSRLRAR